jgi:hypothetical protein
MAKNENGLGGTKIGSVRPMGMGMDSEIEFYLDPFSFFSQENVFYPSSPKLLFCKQAEHGTLPFSLKIFEAHYSNPSPIFISQNRFSKK